MTQEKKSDNKKTLSIHFGKLGLASQDASRNFGMKTDVTYSRVQTGKSNNNTVMIVTKNKGTRSGVAAHSIKTSLTQREQEDRINALLSAEREKRESALSHESKTASDTQNPEVTAAPEEFTNVELSENLQSDLKNDVHEQDTLPNESEADVIDKSSEADCTVQQKTADLEEPAKKIVDAFDSKRSDSIKLMISSKGKVRNLNNINVESKTSSHSDESSSSAQQTKEQIEIKKPVSKKDSELSTIREKDKDVESTTASKKHVAVKRASKKISVASLRILEREDDVDGITIGHHARFRKLKNKAAKQQKNVVIEKVIREVMIPDAITVQELSNRMAEKAADLVKALIKLGIMATINQAIDADTAELIVSEFGHIPKRVTNAELERAIFSESEDFESTLVPRAPIVTVMGHVDHGKTSLLDALRCTDVVTEEFGGITQHIGAYHVSLESKHSITFLDTPGHEAFTAMRMRGAKVTDIVVLVVAADDGIKEQTVEAISHAKAANVPIIVAVNKIDKKEADVQTVKSAMLVHGLIPEEMGGDTMIVEVSARNKIGLDKLEEAILLQAELLSLKAREEGSAAGAVVEAKMDKNKGALATLLVLKGTLKVGNIVVVGNSYGKIRALINDKGEHLKQAGPSIPVEVLGLNQVPSAGDEFIVVQDERHARELVDFRIQRERAKKFIAGHSSMDQLFHKVQQAKIEELPLIVKADVNGSIEAIVSSLMKFSNDEVKIRLMHSGVGAVNESDVTLAATSNALILGFNVRANHQARNLAKQFCVDIKYYSIIYNLIDDIKAAVSGMLAPTIKEKLLGYVEVRQVFDLTKVGKVAGGYVTEGVVQRSANVRLIRDNIVIHEGTLKTLKRFKDDVKEVKSGFECGLALDRYDDIKSGDKLEVFLVTEESRSL